MNSKIYSISEIKNTTKEIFESNNINRAFLFGSYAKGEQTEKSDIDICAEFNKKTSLFEICGILHDLREALYKEVDFFSLDEFSTQPEIMGKIINDGVCIYERK